MNIELIIINYKSRAKSFYKFAKSHHESNNEEICKAYRKQAKECEAIANWLTEYKELKDKFSWRKCSDKTPDDDNYIVQIRDKDCGVLYHPRVAEYSSIMEDWYEEEFGSLKDTGLEVIAWMPLPDIFEPERQVPKWLYRLESEDPNNGLWYNSNGDFVWGISAVKDCKTKDLPMGYDVRYQKDGKDWFSSCSNKEDLLHWYSLKDAEELIANGFVFTRYLAQDYTEYPMQTVFLKETALKREVIDIMKLFAEGSKSDEIHN